MMIGDIDDYQRWAARRIVNEDTFDIGYACLGVGGEAGELLEQVKKCIRDDGGVMTEERAKAIAIEIGDVMWYLVNLATLLKIPFSLVIAWNVDKLEDRHNRGVVRGEGNSR